MSNLNEMQCEACRIGAPQASNEEIEILIKQIPEWSVENRAGVMQLERTYTFDGFLLALQFTNQVGELAEAQGHHPSLLTEWGKVTVTWWTHKINGIHQNDFIMAARTDQIYTE